MTAPLGSKTVGIDSPEVSTCKMEDAFLEIVQPTHLRPFVPLAAQELQDHLIVCLDPLLVGMPRSSGMSYETVRSLGIGTITEFTTFGCT